jgi:hypothetical protein
MQKRRKGRRMARLAEWAVLFLACSSRILDAGAYRGVDGVLYSKCGTTSRQEAQANDATGHARQIFECSTFDQREHIPAPRHQSLSRRAAVDLSLDTSYCMMNKNVPLGKREDTNQRRPTKARPRRARVTLRLCSRSGFFIGGAYHHQDVPQCLS